MTTQVDEHQEKIKLMNNQLEVDFSNYERELRQKKAYFLLAAAGACIGFAITQSQSKMLSGDLVFYFFAILSWGISFYLGYLHVHYAAECTSINSDYARLASGRVDAVKGKSNEEWVAYKEGIEEVYAKQWHKMKRCESLQFYFFLNGSFWFIVWTALEMWRRTPENICLWV